MKVLVTGHAGFIGMHLCEALLKRGHQVVGLDNFNGYYSVRLKRDRARRLEALSGFRGIEGDLADRSALDACMSGGQVDVVCNLAAQPGVRYSLTHPHIYGTSNLIGFLNVIEACRQHRVPKLVYASSSSVYGGNTKLPFSVEDRVDRPVSLYAATKRANELMAHTYSHLFGIQTIGLRFFTVYGPWYRPDMAMWLFTEAMLKNQPIQLFNHGKMKRDFTYVDDVVQGVIGCVEAQNLERYELLNIGNHRSEDLSHLVELLAKALGVEPRIELLPMQPGDVESTFADIGEIQRKIGYRPTTSIDEGVPRFVEWFRAYHGVQ